METRYITVPVSNKRANIVRGIVGAVAVAVSMLGGVALLVNMAYEPKPASSPAMISVSPMEVYTVTATELWAEGSQNLTTTSQSLVNPSPLTDGEWATLCEVCQERGIDVSLALGLIWVESRFNPNAVSKSGCYGYCQINPRWHPANLSPEENIRYGLNYLADQCERYDSVEAGLTAYNAGRDTGSRKYANAVLAAAKEWKSRLNDERGTDE